jgi:multidrug efflux pump subunit AcrB
MRQPIPCGLQRPKKLLRKEKRISVYDAVIEGSSLRVRPILMTSITTIIVLSPLVFGWGEGLEILAINVVGGLSVSMLLTLFVIPCIYTIFHKVKL